MKKCDHFKDLILTDYIDGELDKDSTGALENHLLECGDCRVFLAEVKSNGAMPFRQMSRQTAPTELWGMIRQRIEEENQTSSPLVSFIGQLKGFFIFPRLVPVFASVLLMFLAGSMTLNTIHIQQIRAQDQGEYLVSMLSPTASPDNNDGGTPIEHYFL